MDTSAFGSYEPDIDCCSINFWLDTSVLAGSYKFEVTLSDGVASNTYEFQVKVFSNGKPYFVTEFSSLTFR